MRIDAHQHYWRYTAAEYPWIGDGMQRIARDWLPADAAAAMATCGVDAAIAVQARDGVAETRFLLDLANAHGHIAGVVGWLDLCAPDVDDALAAFAHEPKLKGLRHIVQAEADDFLRRADFQRGVRAAGRHGLTYDVLVFPRQLEAALAFAQTLPDQPLVLDHLGKPNVAAGGFDDWWPRFAPLAACEHLACKLSGLVTEARWNAWQPRDFVRFLDAALDAFGPQRLLFGSDWPVCLVATSDYRAVHDLIADWAQRLSPAERAALFGGNAQRLYRIPT